MHILTWLGLMLFSILPAMSATQENVNLRLPTPDELARIEISNTSSFQVYQPEELRKLLPRFVRVEGTYGSKQPFQRGTFFLKDGRKLTWLANSKDTILLYDGSEEQLYKVSSEQ